jgi:Beta-galactosidase C-terminal domain
LDRSGVEPLMDVLDGVEVTERWQGTRRLLLVRNHLGQPQKIRLERDCTNLMDGNTLQEEIPIEALDILILAENKT